MVVELMGGLFGALYLIFGSKCLRHLYMHVNISQSDTKLFSKGFDSNAYDGQASKRLWLLSYKMIAT